jgi:hypothetical protein
MQASVYGGTLLVTYSGWDRGVPQGDYCFRCRFSFPSITRSHERRKEATTNPYSCHSLLFEGDGVTLGVDIDSRAQGYH